MEKENHCGAKKLSNNTKANEVSEGKLEKERRGFSFFFFTQNSFKLRLHGLSLFIIWALV